MALRKSHLLVALMGLCMLSVAQAFLTISSRPTLDRLTKGSHSRLSMGRRWNFNEGQSPWGLKVNAEIWNGRAAQVIGMQLL